MPLKDYPIIVCSISFDTDDRVYVFNRSKRPMTVFDRNGNELSHWGEGDIAPFFEAAKGMPYYALFYTALFTGMRRSELLALHWQDMDFILSQVYVSRSLHVLKGSKIIFRSPKTAKC